MAWARLAGVNVLRGLPPFPIYRIFISGGDVMGALSVIPGGETIQFNTTVS